MLSNPTTDPLQKIKLSVRGIKAIIVQSFYKRGHGQGVDSRGTVGLKQPELSVNFLKRHGVSFRKKFTEFFSMFFAVDRLFNWFNLSVNIRDYCDKKPNGCGNSRHLLKQANKNCRPTQNVNNGKKAINSSVETRVHIVKLDAIFDIKNSLKVCSIVLGGFCHNKPLFRRFLWCRRGPCRTSGWRDLAFSFTTSSMIKSHGLPHVGKVLMGRNQHFDTCRYDRLIAERGV